MNGASLDSFIFQLKEASGRDIARRCGKHRIGVQAGWHFDDLIHGRGGDFVPQSALGTCTATSFLQCHGYTLRWATSLNHIWFRNQILLRTRWSWWRSTVAANDFSPQLSWWDVPLPRWGCWENFFLYITNHTTESKNSFVLWVSMKVKIQTNSCGLWL